MLPVLATTACCHPDSASAYALFPHLRRRPDASLVGAAQAGDRVDDDVAGVTTKRRIQLVKTQGYGYADFESPQTGHERDGVSARLGH